MEILAYKNDVIAVVVVLGLFTGYHLYLQLLSRRDSMAVLSNAARLARENWVDSVMSDHGDAVLAVQTLRNSTMAASFLASTAILLMVGALTLTGQAQSLEATWHFLNVFGTLAPALWLVKLLSILLVLFYAFFCFANSIRIINHVGYMISIRPGEGRTVFTPRKVASQLNRGSDYFRVGIRAYYHLVPLIFWLFGPLYMILSTAVLVFVMLPRVDRTPAQFQETMG